MLTWEMPQLKDREWISALTEKMDSMGSDTSFANIYLLREKYQTEIARFGDLLIRRYHGHDSRDGYTFPLGDGDVDGALDEIRKDAQLKNETLRFCLLTEEQKTYLEQYFKGAIEISTDAGDSDYIYGQQDLANLSGKAYHKKKNHVSKFKRTYPEYTFSLIENDNLKDVMQVQDMWYYDHLQNEDDSQMKEYEAIKEAVEHFDELGLLGGLLYIEGTPVAMTIASRISANTCDIHFEKAIGESALYGGYSAINMMFAQELGSYQWINREEDIGIEGLRKAKESYHPKILLTKYSAVVK